MGITRRIHRIYGEGGFSEVCRRAITRLNRSTINDVFNVYCWDLSADSMPSIKTLPIQLVPHTNLDNISDDHYAKMAPFNNGTNLKEKIQGRLDNNATLWVLEYENNFSGYVWTIRGGHVDPYFFPLTNYDVIFFDGVTFNEFRGKGIIPYALNRIGMELARIGVRRFICDTGVWNQAMQKGLRRTPFRQIGVARKFTILNKTITIWTDMTRYQNTARMDCKPIKAST